MPLIDAEPENRTNDKRSEARRVAAAILQSGHPHLTKSQVLSQKSSEILNKHILNILNQNMEVVFTTGLGLVNSGIPLRLPAMLLPALYAVKELAVMGADAKFIIYQSTKLISDLNKDADPEATQKISQCMKMYIRKFIEAQFGAQFFKKHIILKFDDDCEIDPTALSLVSAKLGRDSQDKFEQEFQKFSTYSLDRGSVAESTFVYVAANVILNGGYNKYYPLMSDDSDPRNNLMICFGGVRERPFFELNEKLLTAQPASWHVAHVLSNYGQTPGYYPHPGGDYIVGKDLPKSIKLAGQIKHDYNLLEAIGMPIEKLAEIGRDAVMAVSSYKGRLNLDAQSKRAPEYA